MSGVVDGFVCGWIGSPRRCSRIFSSTPGALSRQEHSPRPIGLPADRRSRTGGPNPALHISTVPYMVGREYQVESSVVLKLAATSGRSAYACEFVALARALEVRLVTSDQEVLASFPADA